MGGNNKLQKKFSGFSVFNIFKSSNRTRKGGNYSAWDDGVDVRKIWPSDEDKAGPRQWVADPRIDRRATAYIANFKSRVSESEHQTIRAE